MLTNVCSSDNPADIVSQGVSLNKLSKLKLWWNGSQFLQGPLELSECPVYYDKNALQKARRQAVTVHRIDVEYNFIQLLTEQRSSISKIISYCLFYEIYT